jgi:hypothetical protein
VAEPENLAIVIPDVQFARASGGAWVAYRIAGDGPVDIVHAPGWFRTST